MGYYFHHIFIGGQLLSNHGVNSIVIWTGLSSLE